MKIITTTYEDFVKNEITEHGHDYVEGMFMSGYEPTIVNGIWVWFKERSPSVPIHNQANTLDSNRSSCTLHSSGDNLALSRPRWT